VAGRILLGFDGGVRDERWGSVWSMSVIGGGIGRGGGFVELS
jgi:hypothetical protein